MQVDNHTTKVRRSIYTGLNNRGGDRYPVVKPFLVSFRANSYTSFGFVVYMMNRGSADVGRGASVHIPTTHVHQTALKNKYKGQGRAVN